MKREERAVSGAWSSRACFILLALVAPWALVGGCSPAIEPEAADLSALSSPLAPAATATLLKDLVVSGSYRITDSNPEQYTAVGGTTFFVASTVETGAELWKTDGTTAGTVLVKDLYPGLTGSSLRSLTALGGTLVFSAVDPARGRELWKSDGTASGTVLLKEFTPGSVGSTLQDFTVLGSTLFFVASSPELGTELWKTDGTAAGTLLVKDIDPGSSSSSPSGLRSFNAALYFAATSSTGTELWKTDGTAAGTLLVKDIVPGSSSSSPEEFTPLGSSLFFRASDETSGEELWKTDGTAAGTVLVKDIFPGATRSYPTGFTALGSTLFFEATDGTSGTELWKTDGTAAGTVLVKDIASSGSSYPSKLTAVASTLFFTASDTDHGTELWKTDGTAAGTVFVKDLYPGPASSFAQDLTAFNGLLYLRTSYGQFLKSDGTAAGTGNVTSAVFAHVSRLVATGGLLYLNADDSQGAEPWKSDGTSAGTMLLKDVQPNSQSSQPGFFTRSGDKVFFSALQQDNSTLWGLFLTDGTSAGTVRVGVPDAMDAPGPIAPLNGRVFFEGKTYSEGRELWTSDGTPAGTGMVLDIDPGSSHARATGITPMGPVVYFAAQNPTLGTELWKSDGTAAGTTPVVDIAPGASHSSPNPLAVMNGTLFFSAFLPSLGIELWRTDGTQAGTSNLGDIYEGDSSSDPAPLGVIGDTLYFVARSETQGAELWRTQDIPATPVLVKDINPGDASSEPSHAAVLGHTLYFQATTAATGTELWKSDGTAAGTVLLKDLYPGAGSASPRYLTVVNDRLFFGASTPDEGFELWMSDGTAAGTVLVRDLVPGPESGLADAPLVGLSPEGFIVFTATDGTTGLEPWISEGTAAGTQLLQDVAPGARGSRPLDYLRADKHLYFSADDGTHEREPWVRPLADLADTVAPTVSCPANVTAEATSPTGALILYPPATGADNNLSAPQPSLTYSHASGATFPLGTTPVTVTATDKSGNTATCSFAVLVRDTVAPTVSCPGDRTAEATSASGAAVTFPPATASDAVSTPTLTSSRASGSTFALGATSVTVTATDPSGNSATCTFQVTVRDTTGPTLVCPAPITAEATSPAGAPVSFPPATASDAVSSPTLAYSWAPGSTFPMGTQTVTATATDAAGNSTQCSFQVTVRDSTPPALLCPADVTVEATGPGGMPVSYPPALVSDAVTASPVVGYSRAPGSVFPMGTTQVTVTAIDNAGNRATCSFAVVVQDTQAPTVSCPASRTVEATGPAGAAVVYPPATASDAVTASPLLSYSHASGSAFAVGTTQVTVTARDAAGNPATCAFTLTVQDTVAPQLSCPGDLTAEATGTSGAPVTYPSATATDAVTPSPLLSYSRAPGSTFPLGTTSVTVTATDAAGNRATCVFNVLVRDTTAPTLACPAALTLEALGASGAPAADPSATASDAVTASPAVSYSHVSGSTFPLGTTSVTVTATDAAGNRATCVFTVLVRDTTAPTLSCPATLTLEALGASGAPATYPSATASDAVTASPAVSYSHVSGSTFPLGPTSVTVTATDAAGNRATCVFTVLVRDTTAPTVGCPAPVTVEATSSTGALVTYPPATASDRISSVTLDYSHLSGGTFPLGTTAVTVTATDASGNRATCSFDVRVRDSVAPVVNCPAPLNAEATAPTGTPVTYPAATGSDALSPVAFTYSQASGTPFALGESVVTVTAADSSGNTTSCTFPVRVRDTTAPTLTCDHLLVEATSGTGAPVSFTPRAQDAVTTDPMLTYNRASGGVLPLGTTSITATATDRAGNAGTCTFAVTVQDTLAPTITCPAHVTTQATSPSGSPVTYPPATASDAVTALPALTYSQGTGTLFPVGTTSVTVAATDGVGNHATCSFQVIVNPPEAGAEEPPAPGGCGCASSPLGAGTGWMALVGLAFRAARRRRAR